jgi:hypothetical protein
VEPIRIPVKPYPVREPVGVPSKKAMLGRNLIYECPRCGRELEEVELEGGIILTCPEHGLVQELAYV